MFRLALTWLMVCAVVCSAQVSGRSPVSCDLANNTSANSAYSGSEANAPPANTSKLPIRSLLYEGSNTRIYVRYMPWFGDPKHRDVGYRSDDREQVGRQVADMVSRGIQGAIVDWYGPNAELKNGSTIYLIQEAERQNLEFAISEDGGALADCQKHGCDVTGQLISDLKYAAQHFENSSAYLRFGNRPAVFFFGLEKYPIDWRHVRQSLPLQPLFFFRNSGTFANPDADGAYSWIAPETAGPNDPMGMQYLERFYSKAVQSEKIAMGSAYKGFDDADASWGKGRVIDQQCGQTWLATLALAGRFYSVRHQLSGLIIPTWNDYEEGTEIETGIDNCVTVTASINRDHLSWSFSGRDNTIDHIAILVQQSSQWTDVKDLAPKSGSIPLSDVPLPPEASAVCVEAIGKASLFSHSSGPIAIPSSGRETRE